MTQRFLYLSAASPKAVAILFTGGNGYVGIGADGSLAVGGNFLVRSRTQFVERGVAVAIVDPPSDRLRPPYLAGFRQTAQHVADIAAVIAWLRNETSLPVWLIGTSRGTQSAAFVATQLPSSASAGADGLVLTSTILVGANAQDRAVPQLGLARIAIPVLVVHHRQDACPLCPFADAAPLMRALTGSPRKELVPVDGGSTAGDPCEARAYHGFTGIESSVVHTIADWIAP